MTTLPHLDDPLGEALHDLNLTGVFYSRCEFSAPWGLELPPLTSMLMFHLVTVGSCWIELDGHQPRLLRPGELALVPHGHGHRLVSAPGTTTVSLWDAPRSLETERYEVLELRGGGEPASLVCSTVSYDGVVANNLIASLPHLISVDAASATRSDWVFSTLRLLAAESRHPQPGGAAVVSRLADVLLVLALRMWLEREPAHSPGWLMALRDRQIGQAMSLIHQSPSANWTVASLADAVAMSRSAFAARFTELAGETPMRYVANWRMQVAAAMLRQSDASVAEIAHQIGYQSEAAFSRSFKRWSGVAPGSSRSRPAAIQRF